jgi:hypothetical protein
LTVCWLSGAVTFFFSILMKVNRENLWPYPHSICSKKWQIVHQGVRPTCKSSCRNGCRAVATFELNRIVSATCPAGTWQTRVQNVEFTFWKTSWAPLPSWFQKQRTPSLGRAIRKRTGCVFVWNDPGTVCPLFLERNDRTSAETKTDEADGSFWMFCGLEPLNSSLQWMLDVHTFGGWVTTKAPVFINTLGRLTYVYILYVVSHWLIFVSLGCDWLEQIYYLNVWKRWMESILFKSKSKQDKRMT